MSLPRVLAQRKPTPEVERENFEKGQQASISKAINAQETPVKEKHVRSAIIGTFHEKSAATFWSVVMKLPLQGNPIVCWKFCHVLHKVLREGHQHVLHDSQKYRTVLLDLGKLWGLLKEGYGKLIQCYANFLVTKLDFHKRNPRFPGNLSVSDEELEYIGEHDVNVYFQISCEMFDYMDEVLNLQTAVFGSLDMSRSNSMTNSGQCRLAPLIPCIQDSSLLYDYTVKLLFKLHSALPKETLVGHRDRFYRQFKVLQQFYVNSSVLQYFRHLIQVPLLPDNPPNFLVASELNSHVSPIVILPPQSETPENESIDMNLIDTSVPDTEITQKKFDEVFGTDNVVDFNFHSRNGTVSPEQHLEKDKMIEQLLNEISTLKLEIQRIKIENQQKLDDMKRVIADLEGQLSDSRRHCDELQQELNQLRQDHAQGEESIELAAKLAEAAKKAKAQEEKFIKMKEVYGKLREEHISLIRTKAEVEKHVIALKNSNEDYQKTVQEMKTRCEELTHEKSLAFEKLNQNFNSDELDSLNKEKQSLQDSIKELKEKANSIEGERVVLEEKMKQLSSENVTLQKQITSAEENHKKELRRFSDSKKELEQKMLESALVEGEHIVQSALDEYESQIFSSVTCTPEYLRHLMEKFEPSLTKFKRCFSEYQNGNGLADLLAAISLFSHVSADTLLQGRATSRYSPNIDLGDKLAGSCRALGGSTVEMLQNMRKNGVNIASCSQEVQKHFLEVLSILEALIPKLASDNAQNLGEMVGQELSEMEKAIEQAAHMFQALLNKSRAGDSGIKLEVNGKILDACTVLMHAIKELVQRSKDLQEEICIGGKGSASPKEFYNRNHRWTEGLISASKVVGLAAKFLVDAADKVVSGQAKFEELIVASQEIAAATAQLVVASKVKAERGSANLSKLSRASKNVSEATGNVVATSKSCAQMVEESDVLDFSKLTLHQAKRLEMESQVRVLELESSLVKERRQLAGLRKRHYQLAGPSEGWDENETA